MGGSFRNVRHFRGIPTKQYSSTTYVLFDYEPSHHLPDMVTWFITITTRVTITGLHQASDAIFGDHHSQY